MNISTKTNNLALVGLTAKFLKVFGLGLVFWFVTTICMMKLETLKENNNALTESQLTAAVRLRELDCLTRNVYWEAASEPFEGKVGVAQVTLNRVESGQFANSVCGVVHQKNVFYAKVVCQFSWYCESTHQVKAVRKDLWRESEEVAKRVLLENFRLPSLKNALYYHADYVNPNWNKIRIDKIGRHIFYK